MRILSQTNDIRGYHGTIGTQTKHWSGFWQGNNRILYNDTENRNVFGIFL